MDDLNKSNLYDNDKSVFSAKINQKMSDSVKKSMSFKYSSKNDSHK